MIDDDTSVERGESEGDTPPRSAFFSLAEYGTIEGCVAAAAEWRARMSGEPAPTDPPASRDRFRPVLQPVVRRRR
jgi:hypothetical protein